MSSRCFAFSNVNFIKMTKKTALLLSFCASLAPLQNLISTPAGSINSAIAALNHSGREEIAVDLNLQILSRIELDDSDFIASDGGQEIVLDFFSQGALPTIGGTYRILGFIEPTNEWTGLGIGHEIDVTRAASTGSGGGSPGPSPVPAPTVVSLEEGIALLGTRAEVEIETEGWIIRNVDDEDYVFRVGQRDIIVDFYAVRELLPFATGTSLGIRGELEPTNEWNGLGIAYELDAYSVSSASSDQAPAVPDYSAPTSLDGAIARLVSGRDDVRITVQGKVVRKIDEDDYIIIAEGTAITLDTGLYPNVDALPLGQAVEVDGELELAPPSYTTQYAIDAFSITFLEQGHDFGISLMTRDSDGDGYLDIKERSGGSGVNDVNSIPLEVGLERAKALRFNTWKGRMYQIQASTDLLSWEPRGPAFEGDGMAHTKFFPVSAEGNTYYRVIDLGAAQ
jgi:uncharacterized protein YdeI (BOF family)